MIQYFLCQTLSFLLFFGSRHNLDLVQHTIRKQPQIVAEPGKILADKLIKKG